MIILGILVACIFVVIFSLVVFGGGQIFMPMFKWLWTLLNSTFGINISENTINQIFTVSNATPGVVSTKFAFFTGLVLANNADGSIAWWGYLTMFLTYLVFCLPAIFVLIFAIKYLKKIENKPFMQRALLLMQPVVAGIIVSVGFTLLIEICLPFVSFNGPGGIKEYFKIDFQSEKAKFFSGWRLIVLLIYSVINIISSFYLYRKKVPLFALILANIIISLIVFEPWLN
ncbi:Chromate transport protein [Mycoplasmopsis meleagridis]|uniref:Chromate transport protein n=1 Tax=Mycoplasmopsis meleagridis ATCC 25294 TaxID=1264554 RepID=A0A0F5GZY2_9BACT|nr:chromate transporter [Mycoplasmopsis meleagridis]KKB26621.1 Chromate transport protein [Mycoplasmopsis meleagridis ATCC 25294]OAD18264.1 Chromate transport protein [Mycoplasmopsis meleagridis]VEU77675.1 Chromate transporter [Mycoplasmopsis meleagridis]